MFNHKLVAELRSQNENLRAQIVIFERIIAASEAAYATLNEATEQHRVNAVNAIAELDRLRADFGVRTAAMELQRQEYARTVAIPLAPPLPAYQPPIPDPALQHWVEGPPRKRRKRDR